MNQSMLSTSEKSIVEQASSNDLKTPELILSMKKMKLKETQLALNSNSYLLERMKFFVGISKGHPLELKIQESIRRHKICWAA